MKPSERAKSEKTYFRVKRKVLSSSNVEWEVGLFEFESRPSRGYVDQGCNVNFIKLLEVSPDVGLDTLRKHVVGYDNRSLDKEVMRINQESSIIDSGASNSFELRLTDFFSYSIETVNAKEAKKLKNKFRNVVSNLQHMGHIRNGTLRRKKATKGSSSSFSTRLLFRRGKESNILDEKAAKNNLTGQYNSNESLASNGREMFQKKRFTKGGIFSSLRSVTKMSSTRKKKSTQRTQPKHARTLMEKKPSRTIIDKEARRLRQSLRSKTPNLRELMERSKSCDIKITAPTKRLSHRKTFMPSASDSGVPKEPETVSHRIASKLEVVESTPRVATLSQVKDLNVNSLKKVDTIMVNLALTSKIAYGMIEIARNAKKEISSDFLMSCFGQNNSVGPPTLHYLCVRDFVGDHLTRLITKMKRVVFEQGHQVIYNNGIVRKLFVIESGEVEIRVNSIVVKTLGKGDSIGFDSFLQGDPVHSFSAQATTDCTLWELSKDDLTHEQNLNETSLAKYRQAFIQRMYEKVNIIPHPSHIYYLSEHYIYLEVLNPGEMYHPPGNREVFLWCISGELKMYLEDESIQNLGENEVFGLAYLKWWNLGRLAVSVSFEALERTLILTARGPEVKRILNVSEQFPQYVFKDAVLRFKNQQISHDRTMGNFSLEELYVVGFNYDELRSYSNSYQGLYMPSLNLDSNYFEAPLIENMSIAGFEVLKKVGNGSFGTVYSTTYENQYDQFETSSHYDDQEEDKFGAVYAIKVIELEWNNPNSTIVNRQLREIKIMKRLATISARNQANSKAECMSFLITLYFVFADISHLYLVMDFGAGGDLQNLLDHTTNNFFSEAEAKYFLGCLLLGIHELHRENIIHRDLKLSNLLLDEKGVLKICDFGVATESRRANSFCGTDEYMAPETVRRNAYGSSVDIWAFGVIAFELLYGFTPFHAEQKEKIYDNILNHRKDSLTAEFIKSISPKHYVEHVVSEQARSLINEVLNPLPKLRRGTAARDSLFLHEFFPDGKSFFDDLQASKIDPPFATSWALEREGLELPITPFTRQTHQENKRREKLNNLVDSFIDVSH